MCSVMHCILHTALYWLVDSLSTFILYYATCCITYYYNRIFQAVLAQYTVCHGYLSHVLLMHCILNCILNSIQLCGTLPIILHTAIHNTLPAAFNTMHYILNSVQLHLTPCITYLTAYSCVVLCLLYCTLQFTMHCLLHLTPCIIYLIAFSCVVLCLLYCTLQFIMHCLLHLTPCIIYLTAYSCVVLCLLYYCTLQFIMHCLLHLTPSYAPYCMQFSIVSTMTCNIYYSICISLIAAL